jgi:rRNA-processing protein FCF1
MATRHGPIERTLKIIVDSNALFAPLKLRMDIFEELKTLLNTNPEPIILLQVKLELERIASNGSPQERKDALYALKQAEKCTLISTNDREMKADDAILKAARDWKCGVFTNDRKLRKRLRDINVPVIYLRQKSRLQIDGRL